jgi:hypothetical protein
MDVAKGGGPYALRLGRRGENFKKEFKRKSAGFQNLPSCLSDLPRTHVLLTKHASN